MEESNTQQTFEVHSSPLSKPFYNKNTSQLKIQGIIFGIIFIFIGISASTEPAARVLGFIFTALGVGEIVFSILIEIHGALQTGNCPYCKKELVMKYRKKSFSCPLCRRPIAKTKTSIENAEPLFSMNVTEPNISFEEMRDNFFKEWSLSLQCNIDQRSRLGHARTETVYQLFDINPDNGTAHCYSSNYETNGVVYDVTYKHCTCPDFKKRLRPCKHIYALNVNMAIIKEEEDLSGIPDSVKEKMKQLTPENESYFWSLLRRYNCESFLIKRSKSSKPLLALELIRDYGKNSVLLDKLFSRNDLVAKIYENDIEYKPSTNTTKFEIIDYLIENQPDFVKKIIKNDMLAVFDDEVIQCKQKICDYYLERKQSSHV